MAKTLLVAIAAILLAGCTAGVNYVLKEYGSVKPVDFVEPASQETFRVFYTPGATKLMITPSLGRAFQSGATYGIASLPPEQVYSSVAVSYLRSLGKECSAQDAVEVITSQYEVAISCPP